MARSEVNCMPASRGLFDGHMTSNSKAGKKLPLHQRMSYGIGHVLNDLTASVWFSYMLVYLQDVAHFSTFMAGNIILLGQVTDAFVTPVVGLKSDKSTGKCAHFLGRRKSWHLLGTICVGASFPFLLIMCLVCLETTSEWGRFFYYATFVIFFQFGWAAGQVAHLALINDLAGVEKERIELNAIRYGWTVICNVSVYAIAWALFGTNGVTSQTVTSDDAVVFRNLGLIVVGVGLGFNIIFLIFTRENRYEASQSLGTGKRNTYETGSLYRQSRQNLMTWRDWLRKTDFYMVASMYMCARLTVNVTQIYMPLFIMYSLGLQKETIATVPLAIYISGFAVTPLLKFMSHFTSAQTLYVWGSLNLLAGCVWMWFVETERALPAYGFAICLGIGGTTIIVTSLSLAAELIGSHTESGAFVYGAMSFADKLCNGIAVVVIQAFHPCTSTGCCAACVWYYRDVMSFVPCIATVFSLLVLMLFQLSKARWRRGALEEKTSLLKDETLLDT